jgi:hypothetical protein
MALMERVWPGWNGYFFEPSQITARDARIIGAIFVTGGFILLCMPTGNGR